jgi:hypothetical protein
MKNLTIKILDLIPYRTKFGLSLSDLLKIWYYKNINKDICFCGGYIRTYQMLRSEGDCGWFTDCEDCKFLFDED